MSIGIIDRSFLYSKKAYPSRSILGKVSAVAFKVIFRINYFFYLFVSKFKTSPIDLLKNKLTINRLRALKETTAKYSAVRLRNESDLQDEGLKATEIEKFILDVNQIKKLIEKEGEIKKLTKHSNDIKALIEKVLSGRVYQKNMHSNNLAISFIEELCFTFYAKSKGADLIAEYANKFISGREGEYSFGRVGEILDNSVIKATGVINRNKAFRNIAWFLLFPLKGFNNLLSKVTPLKARPWLTNNNEITICDYVLNGKKARFYHGPNPVGPIFKGHLNYLKKKNVYQLHHNLQHRSHGGEDYRIYELLRYEDQFKNNFRLFSTPMDGKAWSSKDERFLNFKTPDEFYLTFSKHVIANNLEDSSRNISEINGDAFKYYEIDKSKDNGYYIGKNVLKDSQVRKGLLLSKDITNEIISKGSNKIWLDLIKTKKGRRRLSQMMQLLFQSILAFGALIKFLKDVEDKKANGVIDSLFSQSCKQDIDRGVVLNVLTRLFFELIAKGSLTEENIKLIIGTVITRAKLVEKRIILEKRYRPLSDLLAFIGENQDVLTKYLKRYASVIKKDNFIDKNLYQKIYVLASFLNPISYISPQYSTQNI